MRFTPDFDKVTPFCTKPQCDRHMLARHHVKMSSLWLSLGSQLVRQPKSQGWTAQKIIEMHLRYHAFLPQDVVKICNWHHGEIHLLYDIEIDHCLAEKEQKPLNKWSTEEAEWLMDRFQAVFDNWIQKVTPGVDPKFLRPFKNYPLMKAELE